MDQSISCKQIYHIYKHPLSILIHLKFQDKDGCSRNGSREWLFNLRLKNGGNIDRFLRSSILDLRGVPIDLRDNSISCDNNDDERIIWGFKQLNLNINSQFPIVQEEREAMTYLLASIPYLNFRGNGISDVLENPTLGTYKISSVCGHVIGICSPYSFPITFTFYNHSQLLSSLTQLQYLRSLSFKLLGDCENQGQFYEELGDQLGSKLVHLGIEASFYRIQTLEFLSNQMFKFSTLKTLSLSINSRDFNPSLDI